MYKCPQFSKLQKFKMNIKTYRSETFEAEIIMGLRRGYGGNPINHRSDIEAICLVFTHDFKSFVSITEKTFIYNGQIEPALGIKTISYPKFPKSVNKIKREYLILARRLMKLTGQHEIGVIFTDETIILENQGFVV